jgi:HAD superfamily hydrolase (TIGR01509 family)
MDGRIVPFYAAPRPALLAPLGDDFMGARGPEALPTESPYASTEYPIAEAHTEALARYGAVRTRSGLALGTPAGAYNLEPIPGLVTVYAQDVGRLTPVLGPMADEGLLGPEGRSTRVLLEQPATAVEALRLARESGMVVVAAERAGLRDYLVRDGVWQTPDGQVLAPEAGRHHEYHPDGTVRPYRPETWTTQRLYLRSGGGRDGAVEVRDEFGRAGGAARTAPVMLGPAEPRLPHYEMSLPAAFRHLSGGPPLAPAAITVAGSHQRTFPLVVENGKLLMVTDDGRKPLDVVNRLIRVTPEGGTATTPGTVTATDGTLRHVVDRWGSPSQILDAVQRLARLGAVPDPDGLLVFRASDPDGQLARFGGDVRPATGRATPRTAASGSGVAGVLDRSEALLLDFDGPVTDLYARRAAIDGLARVRAVIEEAGVSLPAPVADETNMVAVIRWVAGLGRPDLTGALEDLLTEMDLAVVASAEPTPYAAEVIRAARASGRPVALVSNTSERALAAYLERRDLADQVGAVVGRTPGQPDRWKPHPGPILRAAAELGIAPGSVVLIGDELADVAAARAAGARIIGYANKPWKVERFAAAGVDAVVTSMREIVEALAALRSESGEA